MSTEAWIAVGIVAYVVAGLIFLGVVLGISTTEQIKRFDFVMGFSIIVMWFPLMIICVAMAITEAVVRWRRGARGEREPMDTEAEAEAK